MADEPTESGSQPTVKTLRADDFQLVYANNLVIDSTAWDVRLTFGRYDDIDGKPCLKQNLAASIPFGVAKLAVYWIEAQIIANEIETGRRVGMREAVLPPALPPLTPEQQKSPSLVKYFEAMTRLREKFIASVT
jgi:hypothetical protein